MEQLRKAIIGIDRRNNTTIEYIPVQFNPAELSIDKTVQFAEINIPGFDSPLLQFVRGQNEKITLELFFDTTENGMGNTVTSVTTLTDRFYELLKIIPETHAPPVCYFIWNDRFPGSDVSANIGNQKRNDFQCIVESVNQKFTLFNPRGIPLRATLTVTLREYKTLEEQLNQLGLNSPDRTHSHVVERGDTLALISHRYYGRTGEWRRIAEENKIEDPRRLTVGTLLHIPPVV